MRCVSTSGAIINLQDGGEFSYASAEMDYPSIKFLTDNLYQHFNLVAGIPSSILGQSNIANVSETSTSMIYELTENRAKQNQNALIDGFRQRWEYMRKLSTLMNNPISDEDFGSLSVAFIKSKPVDKKIDMENMKMQYDMGALSKRAIMELSPYTADSAQELQRLEAEGKKIYDNPDNVEEVNE